MPHTPGTSDQTANYAIRNASEDDSLANLCYNIEQVYSMLQPDEQRFCELYYWDKIKPHQISDRLNIGYTKLYELKNNVLYFYEKSMADKIS